MKQISEALKQNRIILGCMRLNSLDEKSVESLLKGAIDTGVTFFDHADIYGGGECETIFSRALKMNSVLREKIILQSKCGIRPEPGLYDFSYDHIIKSVDGILDRLQTEYLDILLLHRPDALVEPEEVARAFDRLHSAGKVRNFGVSNHNPAQIRLLQKYIPHKLWANQLQLSITNATMISSGINVNTENHLAVVRDGSILDFCREHDITVQAWSPFQYGFFEGVFIDNEKFPELNKILQEISEKHNVTKTTIATAWILRHPACMQVIAGTMKLSRLKEIYQACDISLSREDWYEIYKAAGNILP